MPLLIEKTKIIIKQLREQKMEKVTKMAIKEKMNILQTRDL